ncbi:MAG: hypothetical protein P8Y48_18400 [Novosphingobium sp.]
MNWLEKLAYDVGHLFSGGSVRQTAPSSDRGTRFYWNYQAARQYHQQEASRPGYRSTVSDQQIWNNAYRQAGSQVNREFGGLAAFGPVSAATAIAAPVVLGNSLLAQGGTAFLTSSNGGVATRYAMGQDISLETYALDGAVGTATFGVFKGLEAAIGSMLVGPEAAFGSRTGSIVAAERMRREKEDTPVRSGSSTATTSMTCSRVTHLIVPARPVHSFP